MKRIFLTLAVVLASFVAVGSAQAQYPYYGHHHHRGYYGGNYGYGGNNYGYGGGYGYGVVPPVRVYANYGTPYYNGYGYGAGGYVAPYNYGYGNGYGYAPAPGVVYPQRGVGVYLGY